MHARTQVTISLGVVAWCVYAWLLLDAGATDRKIRIEAELRVKLAEENSRQLGMLVKLIACPNGN